MLAGAALHNGDYASFSRYRDKLTSQKGSNHGWALFSDAATAERDLNWDAALDKYKKCADDSDFIDPICSINVANIEFLQGNYSAAKADIDSVLAAHPRNPQAISEGIVISLRVGDTAEADRLHEVMVSLKPTFLDSIECLYYYGRNQPLLATSHCQASVRASPNDYGAWDNAAYVALDNGDFQTAVTYFSKSTQLFYASKDKHTVNQELDLWWGALTAEYYSGDKKRAKELYRSLQKTYPQYTTTLSLKQFPLLWSDTTVKLMDRAAADLQSSR